jgi:hypothetical protein
LGKVLTVPHHKNLNHATKWLHEPQTWADPLDLREVEWGDKYWNDLAQDSDMWWALVNIVMKLQVPQNAGNLSS